MSLLSTVLVLPRSLYLKSWPLSKNSQAIPSSYIHSYRGFLCTVALAHGSRLPDNPYFSDSRCAYMAKPLTFRLQQYSKHINGALTYWMATGPTSQYSQAPPRASQSSVP